VENIFHVQVDKFSSVAALFIVGARRVTKKKTETTALCTKRAPPLCTVRKEKGGLNIHGRKEREPVSLAGSLLHVDRKTGH